MVWLIVVPVRFRDTNSAKGVPSEMSMALGDALILADTQHPRSAYGGLAPMGSFKDTMQGSSTAHVITLTVSYRSIEQG